MKLDLNTRGSCRLGGAESEKVTGRCGCADA